MKRKACWIGIVAVLAIVFSGAPAFSATLGIRPVDLSIMKDGVAIVTPDTNFNVELYFEGLGTAVDGKQAQGLVAMGVSIIWDPLVAFEGAVGNPAVPWNMSFTPTPSNGLVPAIVDIYADVPFAADPIGADHVFATLTLHCLGAGLTELIPRGTLDFPYNFALDNYSYLDDAIQFEGLSINQVPIPSTLLLLGGGLAGIFGLKRRKRS
jgi:hypothetical protein